MSEAEFELYIESMLPEYARDGARAMGWELAKAREMAEAQLARILPDGVATKGHAIAHLEEGGERVGVLWFANQLEESPPRLFLYDIRIDPAHRGRGLGTAMMRDLERIALLAGARELRLSVFEHNTGAIRLYGRLGFAAHERGLGGMTMSKRIGPAA
jgi:ribosomal protein S18 acetylase RimI-like enzyme